MITTNLTKLTASPNMILTDGRGFTHSIVLEENESPEDWSEVTIDYFIRLNARMTPREFILKLMQLGITREQIQQLIDSNDQVWAELNYATTISRANPLLDQLCSQFGLTTADVDALFGIIIAEQENNED